ncbi:MAG: hypothetical protein ACRDL5_04135, partial [Solirubrobacteraceae bacterium]
MFGDKARYVLAELTIHAYERSEFRDRPDALSEAKSRLEIIPARAGNVGRLVKREVERREITRSQKR